MSLVPDAERCPLPLADVKSRELPAEPRKVVGMPKAKEADG
jgi:hypothetical protein